MWEGWVHRWQERLVMIKTRGSWWGGASLLPHLAERPACSPNCAISSAVAFSCWLLHVVQKSEPWSSKCVLPISELCCFIAFQKRCMFYNSVHSIRDSGVAMPAAELVFNIPTYLQLDPEEGRQGGVTLWQGCFHHKFRSHAPSFQCCIEKGTRLCPPCWLPCTKDQWKLCPETAKMKSGNNCSYQNAVCVLMDWISLGHL